MNLGSSSRTLGIDAPEPTVMPRPSSTIVATISAKSAKRQQSGPANTVTLASLRGGAISHPPTGSAGDDFSQMVLAITDDEAFEAYVPRAFPAECVGSICGAAEVLGDLLLWRRPARACVSARAGFTRACTAFLSNTGARQSRPQATGRPARVPMSIGLPPSAGACAELAVIHGQCNPCARHRPSAPGP